MHEYTRSVYYYETDKMGVVHHSNYIRWLEEARNAYFENADLGYFETEEYGVMCPVTEMTVKFKHFAGFGDSFTVSTKLIKYTGVRFRLAYTIVNQDGIKLLEAESGHAFVGPDLKPVSFLRTVPHRHEMMKKLLILEELT